MTIEPEFSLDQPSQINHLVPDGVLAKDSFALRPEDIDFKNQTLRVDRAATDDGQVKDTKTHETRTVDLTPDVVAMLKRHRPSQLMRALRRQQAAGLLVRGMVGTLGDPPRTSLAQALASRDSTPPDRRTARPLYCDRAAGSGSSARAPDYRLPSSAVIRSTLRRLETSQFRISQLSGSSILWARAWTILPSVVV